MGRLKVFVNLAKRIRVCYINDGKNGRFTYFFAKEKNGASKNE